MNVVMCLPGRSFSGNFLKCWTGLLNYCNHANINAILSNSYSSNVYYVRPMCLGANVLDGIDQKPFRGADYDYIMWIDSDIIFNPAQFRQLIEHGKDICGGVYLMEGSKQYAVVKDWDEEYFKKNASFRFLEPKDLEGKKDLMEVSYTGFGFLLIKRGVFENIKYPWFEPEITDFGNGIRDFASEDVSFCRKAQKAGFKIHIDPNIRVGHEKSTILI